MMIPGGITWLDDEYRLDLHKPITFPPDHYPYEIDFAHPRRNGVTEIYATSIVGLTLASLCGDKALYEGEAGEVGG